MKEILIYFLTVKGCKAYASIDEAGQKESKINKKIVKRIYKDSVVSKDPLIVRILIKIPRLAVATEFDKQIIKGLEDKGAKNEKDFKLEVKY